MVRWGQAKGPRGGSGSADRNVPRGGQGRTRGSGPYHVPRLRTRIHRLVVVCVCFECDAPQGPFSTQRQGWPLLPPAEGGGCRPRGRLLPVGRPRPPRQPPAATHPKKKLFAVPVSATVNDDDGDVGRQQLTFFLTSSMVDVVRMRARPQRPNQHMSRRRHKQETSDTNTRRRRSAVAGSAETERLSTACGRGRASAAQSRSPAPSPDTRQSAASLRRVVGGPPTGRSQSALGLAGRWEVGAGWSDGRRRRLPRPFNLPLGEAPGGATPPPPLFPPTPPHPIHPQIYLNS